MPSLNKLLFKELESFVTLQEMSKDLNAIDEVGKEKTHKPEVLKKIDITLLDFTNFITIFVKLSTVCKLILTLFS